MKNGSLIYRGLITTLFAILLGACISPDHFGLLGQFTKNYNPIILVLDFMDYEDCENGRMHEENVCEALRKKY